MKKYAEMTMEELRAELERDCFRFVVPDFRHNKALDQLNALPPPLKEKVEFLCNECRRISYRIRLEGNKKSA